MARVYTNSASTTLTSTYVASDTVLSLTDGSRFATVSSSDSNFQAITLENTTTGQFEIAHITDRTANTVTVSRGQEGTFAMPLPAAEIIVEARLTANALDSIFDAATDQIEIGTSASAASANTISIGASSLAAIGFGVAVGNVAQATAAYSTAVGALSRATNTYNLAVGFSNQSTGNTYSYSFGASNSNAATNSTVLGTSNSAAGGSGVQVLGDNNALSATNNAVVVGSNNAANAVDDFTVLGQGNTIENRALVLGNNFTAKAKALMAGTSTLDAEFARVSLDGTYMLTDRSVIQRCKGGGWVDDPQPRQLIANQSTCAGPPMDIGVPQVFADLGLNAEDQEIWEPNTPNGKQYYAFSNNYDSLQGTATAVTYSGEPTYTSGTGSFTQSGITNDSGFTVCVDPAFYYIVAGYDLYQTVVMAVSEFGVIVDGATVQSGSVTADLYNDGDTDVIATLTITLSAEGGRFVQSTQVSGKKVLAERFHVVITSNTMTDPCPARFYVTGTFFAL